MKKIRYSKTTGSFYPIELKYSDLPVDIIDVAFEDFEKAMNRPEDTVFWFDSNNNLVIIQKTVSRQEVINDMVANIQSYLDKKAQEFGYDNIYSAISYADEPSVPKFKQEGLAFRRWRSLVWLAAHEILNSLDEKESLSFEDVLRRLPNISF